MAVAHPCLSKFNVVIYKYRLIRLGSLYRRQPVEALDFRTPDQDSGGVVLSASASRHIFLIGHADRGLMPELTIDRQGDALIVRGRASHFMIWLQALSIPLLVGFAICLSYGSIFSDADLFLRLLLGLQGGLSGVSAVILLKRFSWSWRAVFNRKSGAISIRENRFCWTRRRVVDVARVTKIDIHHVHWTGDAYDNTNSLELALMLSSGEVVNFGEPWLCTESDYTSVVLEAQKIAGIIHEEIFGRFPVTQ